MVDGGTPQGPTISSLRVNAYVLAADPWWLEESVSSYYDLVDRIVVSYDEDGLSWTGTRLPIDECLRRISAIDRDSKCDFRPGHFARLDRAPLENDTAQRQVALAQASEGAQWVIQIDTDEIVTDTAEFASAMEEAHRRGAGGLEYPARYLHTRSRAGRFLELSRPFWRVLSNYPGPVAVRAGTTLQHCRQADVGLFRVDFAPNSTDPRHPFDAVVHRVVNPDQAILHYSWVRSEDYMRRKAGWSGHADTYSEPARIRAWRWHTRHPLLTATGSGLVPGGDWFRLTHLPKDLQYWRGES